MMAPADWITEKVQIPDLLRTAPQLRPVLDRHGLHGCGGRWGPVESLEFFARAHDVPIQTLLSELRAEWKQPPAPVPLKVLEPAPPLGDRIYRPFFRAGVLVVLTLGAAWGAYLLLRIALFGSFRAAGVHEVNAHGHAQIFGWVGLFVMGFAYQAFPRFKHVKLAAPRLALVSFWLLVVGLVARSVLQPLAPDAPSLFAPAVAASLLEVAAIVIFVGVILATWRSAGQPLVVYDYYILSALLWFVVQAVYESIYLAATLQATGADLVQLVATWQAPLRDIQIHGFALLIILGVSQRLFHPMFGLPKPTARSAWLALAAINAAVVGEVLGLLLMRMQGYAWTGLWYGSVLLLTAATVGLVWSWHIFTPASETNRSLKFLRAAYIWLFISLGMLVLLPVYQRVLLPLCAPESMAAQMGFSHAYYGAIRHAITVGFVSLMIVGVASKVVPNLNGVDSRALPALWLPFVLINAGCTIRVVGQTLTDMADVSFPITGISGLLEVAGLAVWGVHLWWIMAGWLPAQQEPSAPLQPGQPIGPEDRVGAVLSVYPHLLDTFVTFGFTPLANPLARHMMARRITVAAACRFLQVDVAALLEALNARREPQALAASRCGTSQASGEMEHHGCGSCACHGHKST